MEEDLNAIAADCLVISCCCQCLLLQILLIILLKLPCKLFRRAVSFAKKKLRSPRSKKKKMIKNAKKTRRKNKRLCHDHDIQETSNNEELQTFGSCNMDEVERVLGEFFDRGEFGFGRFWDAGEERFPTCLDHSEHQELDYDVVSYHLIQMFGSCSSNGMNHQSLFQL